MKVNIFSLITVMLSLVFFIFSEVNAARPLATDDAETVEPGIFEVELGYEFSKNKDQTQSLEFSLKHGLSERLDLSIAFPYEIAPEKGLGKAEVEMKFSLLKEKSSLPALSLTFAYGFGTPEYTLNGIMTKGIGGLTVHLNLGYMTAGEAGKTGTTTYSGAIEYNIGERFVLAAEIVGKVDGERSSEGLVGGRFSISESLAIDLGIGKGFNSPEWKTTLGLTYEF